VIVLAATIALGMTGCSDEVPVINSFDDSYRYVVAGHSGLMAINMPDGTVSNPTVWVPATDDLYPVTQIREFRDELYVLTRGGEIIILDRNSLGILDTIDLTQYGPPADIAFGNATTAYVSLTNAGQVGIIDLTINSIVRTIDVGGSPVGIAAVGNQICVAIQDRDTAVIIDTRTNDVEAQVAIPTAAPSYVVGDAANNVFCVVALGAGKLEGDDRQKTTPTMTFIDIITRQAVRTVDLTNRAQEGPDQLPQGAVVNASEYAFVPTQTALLSVSLRSKNRAFAAQFDPFGRIYYHGSRAEVVVLSPDGRSVSVFDEFAETKKRSAVLPDSIVAIVGIAP